MFGRTGPENQELEIDRMVSWMEGELSLLVWKKGTWKERVGNREYGVFDAQVPFF